MILLKINVCIKIIIINAGKFKFNFFMEDIFMNKILVILIFLFLANVVSASSYKINDVVYLNACGGNPQVYKDSPLILKNLKEVPNKIIKLEKSKYERNFQTLANLCNFLETFTDILQTFCDILQKLLART